MKGTRATVYDHLSGLQAHLGQTLTVLRRAGLDGLADDVDEFKRQLGAQMAVNEQRLRLTPARGGRARSRPPREVGA